MKKKILKWALVIIVALIVIYFAYSAITAKIYYDIYTAMHEKVNSSNDFYAKVQMEVNEPYETIMEILIKDDVFIKKLQRINTETNELTTLKLWQKYIPEKTDGKDDTFYILVENSANNIKQVTEYDYVYAEEPEDKMYRFAMARSLVLGVSGFSDDFENGKKVEKCTYSKIFWSVIKCPTILYSTEFNGEKCYAVKSIFKITDLGSYLFPVDMNPFELFFANIMCLFDGDVEYISKETKMPVGANTNLNSGEKIYEYFTKEVTEEDIKLPNLEEYEVLSNQ